MPEHMPGPTWSRGVYGFAMYLIFNISFVLFVLWASIPEKWFHNIGITYLPQRYWAVAVPIFILTVIATFAFIIYPSLGLIMTPGIDDIHTVQDEHSKPAIDERNEDENERDVPCICRNQTFCMKHIYDSMEGDEMRKNAIPPMQDLDVIKVSEQLYL